MCGGVVEDEFAIFASLVKPIRGLCQLFPKAPYPPWAALESAVGRWPTVLSHVGQTRTGARLDLVGWMRGSARRPSPLAARSRALGIVGRGERVAIDAPGERDLCVSVGILVAAFNQRVEGLERRLELCGRGTRLGRALPACLRLRQLVFHVNSNRWCRRSPRRGVPGRV